MAVKVGINGFGRIGRNFYRAVLKAGAKVDIVAEGRAGLSASAGFGSPRVTGSALARGAWRHLEGDDVAIRGEEVLQASVSGRDENPRCHLRKITGASKLTAGLCVSPHDRLARI